MSRSALDWLNNQNNELAGMLSDTVRDTDDLRADLARVTAERDAAVADVARLRALVKEAYYEGISYTDDEERQWDDECWERFAARNGLAQTPDVQWGNPVSGVTFK